MPVDHHELLVEDVLALRVEGGRISRPAPVGMRCALARASGLPILPILAPRVTNEIVISAN